jgi:hypothetical protein
VSRYGEFATSSIWQSGQRATIRVNARLSMSGMTSLPIRLGAGVTLTGRDYYIGSVPGNLLTILAGAG